MDIRPEPGRSNCEKAIIPQSGLKSKPPLLWETCARTVARQRLGLTEERTPMPNAHPRPWRKDSLFGAGPRRPLDREQRARFRFLVTAHRRARRIPPLAEMIGSALVRRLGVDGQLDPSHETIAGDVGCSSRTVRRALDALKALGLVLWQRRLVREGWRTEQTSNAYMLVPADVGNLPTPRAPRCDGQNGRQTRQIEIHSATQADVRTAQAALTKRRAEIEARLLNKVSA
jgi:hypothetical protein